MKSTPEYATFKGSNNTSADLPDNQHDLERMGNETAILDLPELKDIPGQEHIKVMPLGEIADTTISSSDEEGVGILDFDDENLGLDDGDDEIGSDDENSVVIDTGDEDDLADEDLDEDEDESDEADIINDDDPEEDYGDDDFITEDDDAGLEEDLDIDLEEEEDEDMDDDLPRAGIKNPSVSAHSAGSLMGDREVIDADISEEEISMLENSGTVEADSDSDNLTRSKLDQTDFEGDVLNEVESTQDIAGNDLDVPGSEMDDANEKIGEEDEENNVYSLADTDT